jgi:hypothetical protein
MEAGTMNARTLVAGMMVLAAGHAAAGQVTVGFTSLQYYNPPTFEPLFLDPPYTESGFTFQTYDTNWTGGFTPPEDEFFKLYVLPSMVPPIYVTQAADVALISVSREDGASFTLQSMLLRSSEHNIAAFGVRADGTIVGSWHEVPEDPITLNTTGLTDVVRVWIEADGSDGFLISDLVFTDITPSAPPSLGTQRVLDFEPLAKPDAEAHVVYAYFEDGFVLNTDIEDRSPAGFEYFGAQHPDYQGSTTLRTRETQNLVSDSCVCQRVQRDDRSTFTLDSIDLHRRPVAAVVPNRSIDFYGQRADGSIVMEQVFIPSSEPVGDPGVFYTATLFNMTDLIAAQWSACGWYEFDNVRLTVPGNSCPADFNQMNGVTVQDIFDFLTDWSSQSTGGSVILASADFNGAGGVTVQDIFDFLQAWSAGCS